MRFKTWKNLNFWKAIEWYKLYHTTTVLLEFNCKKLVLCKNFDDVKNESKKMKFVKIFAICQNIYKSLLFTLCSFSKLKGSIIWKTPNESSKIKFGKITFWQFYKTLYLYKNSSFICLHCLVLYIFSSIILLYKKYL